METPQHFTESMLEIQEEVKKEKEKGAGLSLNIIGEFSYWFWYLLCGIFLGLMLMSVKGIVI